MAFPLAGCSAIIDTDPAKLSAVGQAGKCSTDCDDGVECTIDECGPDNKCRHRASVDKCDDGIGCTEDLCDAKKGCTHEEKDARCEFCAPGSMCSAKVGGCIGFTEQRNCDDNDPCTKDACVVAESMCMSIDVDADEDNHPAASVRGMNCGGDDCDDTRPGVYPGAPEVCNGRDDNCDGDVDEDCMASPDTCDSAVTLSLKGESGTIEGAFAQVQPNFDVTCGANGTPDAVYRLDLTGAAVDIVLETEAGSAALSLAGGTSCGAEGFKLGCAEPLARGTTRLVFHNYQQSELFILVDAKDKNETGNYKIKYSVTSAAGDVCLPTVFDDTACGTLVGVMPEGQGQLAGGCQGGIFGRAASEGVVRFSGLTEKVTLRATGDGFNATLYARNGCGSFTTELACNSRPGGGEAKIDLEPSDGDIYVVVDGALPGQTYTLVCGP
ncbi:MAG: putative metal-binding motif-containing protein [Myxococcales bacterium]